MSEHAINIEDGQTVRLKTAGKYCDRDIVVTVVSGRGDITPNGEIEITENGTYDVTEYTSAVVNVEQVGGTTEIWTLTMEDGTKVQKQVVVA